MRIPRLVTNLAVVCVVGAAAGADFNIHFDQTEYVAPPGRAFQVQVLIDPAPVSGLFSYGVKLTIDAAKARVQDANSIFVPSALDFNGGNGAGAIKAVGTDFAGVKGTVNFFNDPLQTYGGALLATFNVVNLTEEPYPLTLDLFNTLGPTESIFVAGDGQVLDRTIQFGSAMVVPEVSSLWLIGWGVIMVRLWAKKKGNG